MATALFVRQDSIYKTLGIECYDIDRNALTFSGDTPVIVHPPCRAWGRLRKFAKPRPGEKELALWAIDLVRKNGGVLEHPRSTGLIDAKKLPVDGTQDQYGGFCLSVNQSWWGHKAEKKTLLYICGCKPGNLPPMPLNFNAITHCIGGLKSKRKDGTFRRKNTALRELSKANNERTPIAFAKWLIEVANICKPNPNYLKNQSHDTSF